MDSIAVRYLWSKLSVSNGQLMLHDIAEGDARDASVAVSSPSQVGESAKNPELEGRDMVSLHMRQRVPTNIEEVDGTFEETSQTMAVLEPSDAEALAEKLMEHADDVRESRE